jgi:hypothetical protein
MGSGERKYNSYPRFPAPASPPPLQREENGESLPGKLDFSLFFTIFYYHVSVTVLYLALSALLFAMRACVCASIFFTLYFFTMGWEGEIYQGMKEGMD